MAEFLCATLVGSAEYTCQTIFDVANISTSFTQAVSDTLSFAFMPLKVFCNTMTTTH